MLASVWRRFPLDSTLSRRTILNSSLLLGASSIFGVKAQAQGRCFPLMTESGPYYPVDAIVDRNDLTRLDGRRAAVGQHVQWAASGERAARQSQELRSRFGSGLGPDLVVPATHARRS